MNFLSLDVGTTCCKCQLFSENGTILAYKSEEYPLTEQDGKQYVDIIGIRTRIFSMMKDLAPLGYGAVCISSFGEAFVLLDEKDNVLFFPMLYTDPRGGEEAAFLRGTIGSGKLFAVTGTTPNAMYSMSKLLWIRNNCPELYRRADKLLLICDYLGYLLTGERVIDFSLAARTGVFDVHKKQFAAEILQTLGIDGKLFSRPMPTGSIVGELKADVKRALSLSGSCRLVLGSHDQICATIGAGVIAGGDAADGMGTVECITAVFDNAPTDLSFGEKGYCVVPFLKENYCTYMFNYTSNAVVNWFRRDILHGYKGTESQQFSYLEGRDRPPTDVLMLPYFAGCATPFQDPDAKGAFLNLTRDTCDLDLYRAILEGTSFEMKLNLEEARAFGIEIKEMTATGGGANSALWLQIKSDILSLPVNTLRSSEGGLCGCAMLCAAATGVCRDLAEARAVFVQYKNRYLPQTTYRSVYADKYGKYRKLYQTLKEFF